MYKLGDNQPFNNLNSAKKCETSPSPHIQSFFNGIKNRVEV